VVIAAAGRRCCFAGHTRFMAVDRPAGGQAAAAAGGDRRE